MIPKFETHGKTKAKKIVHAFLDKAKNDQLKKEIILHIKRGDARSQEYMLCFEHEGKKYGLDRCQYIMGAEKKLENTCNHSFYILIESIY